MFFRANLKFKAIGLIALAFLVLAAQFTLADDKVGVGVDIDELATKDIHEVLTQRQIDEVLKDPDKAMSSIKNNPYDEKFNQAYRECSLKIFPPISSMLDGPPDKEYFKIDRKEMAAHGKCMSDKGFKGYDYGQDDVSYGSSADLDRNYKKIEDSYKMLDDAMKHLEDQRKLIAEQGMGAVSQEDMDKFSVPVTRGAPSRVYRFDRDHKDDSHDKNEKRGKKKE